MNRNLHRCAKCLDTTYYGIHKYGYFFCNTCTRNKKNITHEDIKLHKEAQK